MAEPNARTNTVVKLATAAVVLAIGMILSSSLLSKLFVRIAHEQALTVKGYAEKDLLSDVGKFTCMCNVRGANLKEAYDRLQESKKVVLEYLKKTGFQPAEISSGTIDTSKIAKRDEQGKETNEIEFYSAGQTISVTSRNVALIQDVSSSITDLIQQGIDIRAFPPAFFISDLKDAKLGLLAEATADGFRRAQVLAENSKGKVGELIGAQQGVFQITQRNSTDTSGGGEYDTSTIEKTAKVAVTLQYALRSK